MKNKYYHKTPDGIPVLRNVSMPVVVSVLKMAAATGIFTGSGSFEDVRYCDGCRILHHDTGTLILFTRDEGYHSCGWWKNPDYERCYHLSISFKGVQGDDVFRLPRNSKLTDKWIDAFYGDDKKKMWTEPPYSKAGKAMEVWHYRLFCDEAWQPIKPKGEVYSRDQIPEGFMSFSELNDYRERLINKHIERKLNG